MDALLRRLINQETEGFVAGTPLLPRGLPLVVKYFRELPKSTVKRLLYVDGGNAPLLKAPHFQYEKVRVATLTMQGTVRVTQSVRDFDLIVYFDGNHYRYESIPETVLNKLVVSKDDAMLQSRTGVNALETLAGLARRLLELQYAETQAKDHDVIVIDGSLEPGCSQETPLLERLWKKNVLGLMKTTAVNTSTGMALTTALNALATHRTWWYAPLTTSKLYKGAVKLHPKSPYVFRLEATRSLEPLIAALRDSAIDPVFLGYPYPLVLVDSLARISNQEARLSRTKLLARYGTKLKDTLVSLNAHEILDTL